MVVCINLKFLFRVIRVIVTEFGKRNYAKQNFIVNSSKMTYRRAKVHVFLKKKMKYKFLI